MSVFKALFQWCGSAFVSMRIRIRILAHHFRPIWSGSRVLMTKNVNLQLKKIIWSKHAIFFFPMPIWRTSKLQERPSALKKKHLILQNNKFFLPFFYIFVGSFLRIQIQPTKIKADPDPQHFFIIFLTVQRLLHFAGLPGACAELREPAHGRVLQHAGHGTTPSGLSMFE